MTVSKTALESLNPAEPRLKRIVFFGLLAGSSSFVPLPFLDDWILGFVRRRMLMDLFQSENLAMTPELIRAFYALERRSGGCASSVLLAPLRLIVYVIRRLFKKIVFLFAIKEATDRASEVFHEGYLISYALQSGGFRGQSPGPLTQSSLQQMHYAIVETMREVDTSPIRATLRQIFRGSRAAILQSASVLTRLGKREGREAPEAQEAALGEEERLLDRILNPLTALISAQREYLLALQQRFQQFARRRGVL